MYLIEGSVDICFGEINYTIFGRLIIKDWTIFSWAKCNFDKICGLARSLAKLLLHYLQYFYFIAIFCPNYIIIITIIVRNHGSNIIISSQQEGYRIFKHSNVIVKLIDQIAIILRSSKCNFNIKFETFENQPIQT